MEVKIKQFGDLSVYELYKIYKLRSAVFVVEQDCVYQDIDELDLGAYHVWLEEDGEILAYLRVLDKRTRFEEVSLGRIISAKRRCGLGSIAVEEGKRVAVERFGADRIRISAQTYAMPFYERAGFVAVSEEYLEDGIPHREMLWEKK